MAREPFAADDLGAIKMVLDHFPMAADLVRLVRRVDQSGAYPITSCAALIERLGGEEAKIQFMGREWPAAGLRRFIPAYYFPIASSEDLAAKLVELGRQRRRHRHGMHHGHGPWAWAMPKEAIRFKRRMFGHGGPHHEHMEPPPPWAERWEGGPRPD